jgi:TRAP-type mannitol/chloroaromatic compound transport system permease small subunit
MRTRLGPTHWLEAGLALVLLIAFFLPWLAAGPVSLSGYTMPEIAQHVPALAPEIGMPPRQIVPVGPEILRLYLALPVAAAIFVALQLTGLAGGWAVWILVGIAALTTAHVPLTLGPAAARAAGPGLILSALATLGLLWVAVAKDQDRFVRFVDQMSLWIGHSFGWCILILTFGISYEVFVRYALRAPTTWAYDIGYMMYGAMFLMAGAYTLSRGGHVRGDFAYRLWPPRVQATVDLVLYILFLLPGSAAMVYAGWGFARQSWRFLETSIYSPAGVPLYPMKTLVPLAGILLIVQGIAEVCRCWRCIRTGQWPRRLHDVEELEVAILHGQPPPIGVEGARP